MDKINRTRIYNFIITPFCVKRDIDESISVMDNMNRIFVVPNVGIRKNPAPNVPTILPIVDIAYRLPTVEPEVSREFILSFTAYGDTIPSSTLGSEKSVNVLIIVRSLKFSIDDWNNTKIGSLIIVTTPISSADIKMIQENF